MKVTENPSVVWKKLVFKKKMNQKKSKELLDFRGDWNCTEMGATSAASILLRYIRFKQLFSSSVH